MSEPNGILELVRQTNRQLSDLTKSVNDFHVSITAQLAHGDEKLQLMDRDRHTPASCATAKEVQEVFAVGKAIKKNQIQLWHKVVVIGGAALSVVTLIVEWFKK